MEGFYNEGKIRAISVANFEQQHLEKVMEQGSILHEYLVKHNIQHVAWGPFGHGNKQLLNHPVLTEIAEGNGKSTAQVMLRWCIQRNIAVIPKSINPARLKSNMELFDFGLSEEEMNRISALDQNK
ncbi:aldo/keto reductase [Fontibacillus panacisegetis]|uniref:aldo/keto reductase n=1 Tax=Fontibacillus panacisegetis TaxID=670482 RepID=UPI001FDF9054|nr:aldo/keto reductase [Fontibacillus panacisegetis]